MVLAYAKAVPEATIKTEFGVEHWVHDLNWQDSLLRLFSQPTINIEGSGRWLHRTGRQDRAATQGGGEDRHAPRTGHDGGGHARQTQGASGQARVSAISR